MRITGTHIAYHFICARKLWLFHHNIRCEQESDAVRMGKYIHETSYKRKHKEIAIGDSIVIDWIDHSERIVHEVKKSQKMQHSHKWQLRFYMWKLKQKGLLICQSSIDEWERDEEDSYIGELNYPKLNKKEFVLLTQKHEQELTGKILPSIERICRRKTPPGTIDWNVCKSCAYCELCYA